MSLLGEPVLIWLGLDDVRLSICSSRQTVSESDRQTGNQGDNRQSFYIHPACPSTIQPSVQPSIHRDSSLSVRSHVHSSIQSAKQTTIRLGIAHPTKPPNHQFITKTCIYNFDSPLLYSKTGVYRGVHYFLYVCSKRRLWVLVRDASPGRF